MFQGEEFVPMRSEEDYKKVEPLDLEAVAEEQKKARNGMTIDPLDDVIKNTTLSHERKLELLRPPREGVTMLLSGSEIHEVREKIRADDELAEYYERARGTLNGGEKVSVDRGRIINQMFNEIPPSEPEHKERLIQLIRGTIIHPLL